MSVCKDMDLLDTMSVASSTADGCFTPTGTIPEGGFFDNDTAPRDGPATTPGLAAPGTETVPCPGDVFIIRSRANGRTITLVNGELQLCEGLHARGGYHWACAEKDGWLGFRNCVSGTYMGHDERRRFVARVQWHKGHEKFCVRSHPRGGFELLMRHGDELHRMAVGKDGKTLVEEKTEGTVWNFYKV